MHGRHEMVHVFLYLPVLERLFECDFTAQATLDDNLELFSRMNHREMGHMFCITENTVVQERETGVICSRNMSLRSIGLYDGITLELY